VKRYAVKELFSTLQGEGGRSGARSIFVRFAGCNLWNGRVEDRDKGIGACAKWCDTDFAKGEPMTSKAIFDSAADLWPWAPYVKRWLVVTGGEPMLQLDTDFVRDAHDRDWKVAVESNGTIRAVPEIDWLTISPKRGSTLVQKKATELKVVLPGGIDGEGWSDDELKRLAADGDWGSLYVQPQDVVGAALGQTYLTRSLLGAEHEFKKNLKRCIDFVEAHPNWRLSFQTHKVTGLR
jgi:7-carboxy-7-deazaguanine synthase